MHPIILSDFYQCRRSLFQGLVFVALLVFALKYFLGFLGVILALVFLVPAVSGAVGVGTMSEEYVKGHFRFLYTLPVRRTDIWFIKAGFGLTALLLAIAIICIFGFLGPSQSGVPKFEKMINLSIGSLAAIIFCQCLYSYATGFFSTSMCITEMSASLISGIFTHLPLFAFGSMYIFFGIIPRFRYVWLVLLMASLPLFIGSLSLFSIRNPYMEQKWRWRGVGLCFGLVTIVVFCLTNMLSVNRGGKPERDYIHGVLEYYPSPDGEKVFVVAEQNQMNKFGYVLAKDGRLVTDLGSKTAVYPSSNLIWRPANGQNYLLYKVDSFWSKFGLRRNSCQRMVLFNLKTNEKKTINNLNSWGNKWGFYYRKWSEDGKYLLGYRKVTSGDNSVKLFIFKQDVAAGEVEIINAFEDSGSNIYFQKFLDDNRILIKENRGDAEGEVYSVLDLNSSKKDFHKLPPETVHWRVSSDGERVVFLEKLFAEGMVRYRISAKDVESGAEKILMDSNDLPRCSFEEAARGKETRVSMNSSSGRWFMYKCEEKDGNTTEWLINAVGGMRYKLMEYERYKSNIYKVFFSRDATRLCIVYRTDECAGDTQKKLLEVYDISESGLQKIRSVEVDENSYNYKFFGNDRVLYITQKDKHSWWRNSNELWVLNISGGNRQRFYCKGESQEAGSYLCLGPNN